VEADPGLLLAGLIVMGFVTGVVGKSLLSLCLQDLSLMASGCKIVDWLALLMVLNDVTDECCQAVHGTCKALAVMMRSLNCQVSGLHVSDAMS
jgi:hypothetical protein